MSKELYIEPTDLQCMNFASRCRWAIWDVHQRLIHRQSPVFSREAQLSTTIPLSYRRWCKRDRLDNRLREHLEEFARFMAVTFGRKADLTYSIGPDPTPRSPWIHIHVMDRPLRDALRLEACIEACLVMLHRRCTSKAIPWADVRLKVALYIWDTRNTDAWDIKKATTRHKEPRSKRSKTIDLTDSDVDDE
jgi:hypothetical protein